MNPSLAVYGVLGMAILLEVIGTMFLQKSDQFTRPAPTLLMGLCYLGAFYFLSHVLKSIPVGVAYALWSGLGILLISLVGYLVFRQSLDLAAWIGIGFIILGVIILNVFSSTVPH
ncbi:DMT family transporter [Ectothiorhodospira lacustris]|uniref:DMT family transporter n=2 Tax=Ectothiorhodospira lacustris TaxID=2899127 RepID=UPI001EE94CC1|nr:multidrug efflux SMR transporter [Ectothiorhodospira lacustris]MCG5510140.1 multidrug efflux SMR transporter [Ectothiorhodospira lacustris]MCG5521983.1 multidrug efflux SMR transporter [Ectothiorhodospira lacustris]